MSDNLKAINFPVYLKNPKTGDMVALLSEAEWMSAMKVGKKVFLSRHLVRTHADRLYLNDLLHFQWELVSAREWNLLTRQVNS